MAEAVLRGSGDTRPVSAPALARLIALLLPASLLAGAYGSQYFGGLIPCEMCWWQRYAHFAAIPFALFAFAGLPEPAIHAPSPRLRHWRLGCPGRSASITPALSFTFFRG